MSYYDDEATAAALTNAGIVQPGQTSAEVAEAQAEAQAAPVSQRPDEGAKRAEWAAWVDGLGGDSEGLTIAELKAEGDRLTG